MKHLNNKTTRALTAEEHRALIDCAEILGKAFKKVMWQCNVNPNEAEPTDVFGISFAFNQVGGHKNSKY